MKLLTPKVTLILFFVLFTLSSKAQQDPLSRVVQKFLTYQGSRPIEKVFLHLDKPYYVSGENIWFKAYLVDGVHLKLDSSISKVIYVDLLDSEHNVIKQHILYSPEGIAFGDLQLSDSLPQGHYLIRAYTNYLKNFGEDFYYTKEISVYNDAREAQQVAVKNEIDLQFFPEGGNLVAGIENRVALKAINYLSKSVEVAGSIVDEQDVIITTFESEHKGMGTFKFTPVKGKKYLAKLEKPMHTLVSFPQVQDQGYVMQVVELGNSFKVSISSNQPNSTSFNLVGQSRGEVRFAARGEVKGAAIATVPKNKFPTGVVQLTVFDGAGQPQCERLVFVNHEDNTKLKVISDKTSYKKKEKVELQINALSNTQETLQGNFSVSVYDETLLAGSGNYDGTLADYLLLTSDLTGIIEEPTYYLKDRSPKTVQDLELIMMTHGWRRFAWKEILKDEPATIAYYAERGIRLSGKVLKTIGQKPAANATLKIVDKKGDIVVVKTDEQGRFYTEDLIHYDSMRLAIQTDNQKGKQVSLKIVFDPFSQSPASTFENTPLIGTITDDYMDQVKDKRQSEIDFDQLSAKMLQEVNVTAKREEIERRPAIYSNASATITSKSFKPSDIDLFQALQGKIPGVIIRGLPPSIQLRGGDYGPPLFLLDGSPVDLDVLRTINPSDIEYVDILRGPSAAIFGSRAEYGVMAVYLKRGENADRPEVGFQRITCPGFYRAREFYSPQYDDLIQDLNAPDIRPTLYWNPSIETDDKGNAKLSFFTSPKSSKYRIVVQGLTYDGKPATAMGSFSVN